MNLMSVFQVVDVILGNEMFIYYDRFWIVNFVEKVGFVQRVLEYYEDINDIKRVVVYINLFKFEWLVDYFG